MKETDMENLFEEEQRLGHICLKPATSASTILTHYDDEHLTNSKDSSSYETHDEDESNPPIQHPILYHQLTGNQNNDSAVDLSRTEIKTGNLLATIPGKSPSPITPSPSPPNESLLQILANQMLKNKQEPSTTSRLLTIASPTADSTLKRTFNQFQQDDEQQHKWDEAAMALLSLNKPPPPPPSAPVEQQAALQSVINGLLRKPNPPKATIDYHSTHHSQGENFHHHTSFDQWKTLMNYFSMPPTQQQQQPPSTNFNTNIVHSQQQHEPRGDIMPLKLRMKMLNAKS
jgi:hypothetical protein